LEISRTFPSSIHSRFVENVPTLERQERIE
jgi:hypothetical protein